MDRQAVHQETERARATFHDLHEQATPAEFLFDHVVAALHRRLDAESDTELARGMHCPGRWDPFFDSHREQLTLAPRALR